MLKIALLGPFILLALTLWLLSCYSPSLPQLLTIYSIFSMWYSYFGPSERKKGTSWILFLSRSVHWSFHDSFFNSGLLFQVWWNITKFFIIEKKYMTIFLFSICSSQPYSVYTINSQNFLLTWDFRKTLKSI